MKNRLIFYNGKFYTNNNKMEYVDYIVVENGKIIDMGNNNNYKKYEGSGIKVINMKERLILPGFIDSHVHFTQTGLEEMYIDASKLKSINNLYENIKNASKTKKNNEWIIVSNFNERNMIEKRHPTIDELKKLDIPNPILIMRLDAHACIVDNKAFKLLDVKDSMEGVDKNKNNQITGLLVANANNKARIAFSELINDEDRLKAHKIAESKAVEKGITYLNALEGGNKLFSDKDVEQLKVNSKELNLNIKIFQQSLNVEKVMENGFNQIGGCITLDGSLGSHTAALKDPYEDSKDSRGILYYSDEQIFEFVDKANKNNLQITTHCIGDRAIDQMLRAYEYAFDNYKREDHRHRIEHFSFPDYKDLDRVAKLNLVISAQPSFDYYNKNNLYLDRLGFKRSKRVFPFRKMIDKGLVIAGGSDSPVTTMDAILGIHSAVNMRDHTQRLNIKEAIDLFTKNGAYASFEEENRGTLDIGKVADFVILDENIFEIDIKNIKDVKVLATYIEGEKVF